MKSNRKQQLKKRANVKLNSAATCNCGDTCSCETGGCTCSPCACKE